MVSSQQNSDQFWGYPGSAFIETTSDQGTTQGAKKKGKDHMSNHIRVYIKHGPHIYNGSPLYKDMAFGECCCQAESTPWIGIDGQLPDLTSLPPAIQAVTVKVSYHGSYNSKLRENGIYCHRTARAVVEGFTIRVEAADIADAAELYRAILAGQICPETSFEGQQIKLDSVRSLLKLAIDVACRKLSDLHFRFCQS